MSVKPNYTVNFKRSICDVLLKVNLALNCAMVTSWYSLGTLDCGRADRMLALGIG